LSHQGAQSKLQPLGTLLGVGTITESTYFNVPAGEAIQALEMKEIKPQVELYDFRIVP